MLWKENIREFMKRIRQRLVRSGGSGRMDRMMWVVRSDEDGDGRTKMGTNPDKIPVRGHVMGGTGVVEFYNGVWSGCSGNSSKCG